jgi:hypothetical protein
VTRSPFSAQRGSPSWAVSDAAQSPQCLAPAFVASIHTEADTTQDEGKQPQPGLVSVFFTAPLDADKHWMQVREAARTPRLPDSPPELSKLLDVSECWRPGTGGDGICVAMVDGALQVGTPVATVGGTLRATEARPRSTEVPAAAALDGPWPLVQARMLAASTARCPDGAPLQSVIGRCRARATEGLAAAASQVAPESGADLGLGSGEGVAGCRRKGMQPSGTIDSEGLAEQGAVGDTGRSLGRVEEEEMTRQLDCGAVPGPGDLGCQEEAGEMNAGQAGGSLDATCTDQKSLGHARDTGLGCALLQKGIWVDGEHVHGSELGGVVDGGPAADSSGDGVLEDAARSDGDADQERPHDGRSSQDGVQRTGQVGRRRARLQGCKQSAASWRPEAQAGKTLKRTSGMVCSNGRPGICCTAAFASLRCGFWAQLQGLAEAFSSSSPRSRFFDASNTPATRTFFAQLAMNAALIRCLSSLSSASLFKKKRFGFCCGP